MQKSRDVRSAGPATGTHNQETSHQFKTGKGPASHGRKLTTRGLAARKIEIWRDRLKLDRKHGKAYYERLIIFPEKSGIISQIIFLLKDKEFNHVIQEFIQTFVFIPLLFDPGRQSPG